MSASLTRSCGRVRAQLGKLDNIRDEVHCFGINLRFLGYIRACMSRTAPMRAFLLAEMVARCAKQHIRSNLRLVGARSPTISSKRDVLTRRCCSDQTNRYRGANECLVREPQQHVQWSHEDSRGLLGNDAHRANQSIVPRRTREFNHHIEARCIARRCNRTSASRIVARGLCLSATTMDILSSHQDAGNRGIAQRHSLSLSLSLSFTLVPR